MGVDWSCESKETEEMKVRELSAAPCVRPSSAAHPACHFLLTFSFPQEQHSLKCHHQGAGPIWICDQSSHTAVGDDSLGGIALAIAGDGGKADQVGLWLDQLCQVVGQKLPLVDRPIHWDLLLPPAGLAHLRQGDRRSRRSRRRTRKKRKKWMRRVNKIRRSRRKTQRRMVRRNERRGRRRRSRVRRRERIGVSGGWEEGRREEVEGEK